MTQITANSPLNLWLANTRVELYKSRLQAVEQLLTTDGDPAARCREALTQIELLWSRVMRATEETTYEGAVDVLTRE